MPSWPSSEAEAAPGGLTDRHPNVSATSLPQTESPTTHYWSIPSPYLAVTIYICVAIQIRQRADPQLPPQQHHHPDATTVGKLLYIPALSGINKCQSPGPHYAGGGGGGDIGR